MLISSICEHIDKLSATDLLKIIVAISVIIGSFKGFDKIGELDSCQKYKEGRD